MLSRNRNKNRGKMRKKLAAVMLLSGIFIICIVVFEKNVIEPNLCSVSEIRARGLVQKTINSALAQEIKGQKLKGQLFTVKEDKNGNPKMVQADSAKINILLTGLSINIQNRFQDMNKNKMTVPLGTLLGSSILSETGPDIGFYIIPLSISSMDFNTEFVSKGINQTKYKIYINVDCDIKVIAPFSNRNVKTSSQILIAEAVIVGDVPNSYVKVPKEDILDVTEE